MAIYRYKLDNSLGALSFKVIERPIYGSSRVGVDKYEHELYPSTIINNTVTTTPLGYINYELSDHLGNVMAVVSDILVQADTDGDEIYDENHADVVALQDYEPFGSLLPGRNYSSDSYRFGFNGQEKDDEINGATGTSYTAEFWQYDPRVAVRWNLDPVVKPFESGYAVFGRSPVYMIDPNGADWFKNNETGKTTWHSATGKQGEEVSLKDMEGTWTNLGTEFLEFDGQSLTYSWQESDSDGNPYVRSELYDAVSGKGLDIDYWNVERTFH